MFFYLLNICLISITLAAPQGYNYRQPAGQGLPIIQTVGGNSGISSSSINNGLSSIGSSSINNLVAPRISSSGSGFQSSGLVSQSNFQQQQQQQKQAVVTKHFYIHSAPEETEEELHQQTLNVGQPRKHYNIVFIKAPSISPKAAALTVAQAQAEERTIIYVLTKKTDASDIHTAVQDSPQQLSKPEVFFIKYKTQEEAQHAQHQIQAQYDALGGTSQVSDEGVAPLTSVIGSVGTSGSRSSGSASSSIGGSSISSVGGSSIGSLGSSSLGSLGSSSLGSLGNSLIGSSSSINSIGGRSGGPEYLPPH